jgi:propanol-preferring alcohol dehydrogenase
MRALQITALREPLDGVVLPDPSPGPGEVLVEVRAAGICRSDVHYRAGTRPIPGLPIVPGHEVAGVVSAIGDGVAAPAVGDRVALHYLSRCGRCRACIGGAEQFCVMGQMLGFNRQGGYAEAIVVDAENAVPVPDGVPLEWAAVMMCSTSTAFHALRRGRLAAGESVAVVGAGGLGASAIQVARAMGARTVVAIDINPAKLSLAESWGAVAVDARDDPAAAGRAATGGRGVDVALELVGSPETMRTCIDVLADRGRAVAVGLAHEPTPLWSFTDLVVREAEILGSADHLLDELPVLLDWAAAGVLDLSQIVSRTVPLEQPEVEQALHDLEGFGDAVRTVITP